MLPRTWPVRTEGRKMAMVRKRATMLRRQLRHMQRYLSMTLMLIGMPIVLLLLFVYVFGGTLGAGCRPTQAACAAALTSP